MTNEVQQFGLPAKSPRAPKPAKSAKSTGVPYHTEKALDDHHVPLLGDAIDQAHVLLAFSSSAASASSVGSLQGKQMKPCRQSISQSSYVLSLVGLAHQCWAIVELRMSHSLAS